MALLLQQLNMNSQLRQQQPPNNSASDMIFNAMKMGGTKSGGGSGSEVHGSIPPPLPLMNALKLEDLEKF